jgi:hypothetical protein
VRKIPRLPLAVLLLMLLLRLPIPSSWADLAATPGTGALIAYKLIGSANHAAIVLCDTAVGETLCATITGANAVKVDNSAVTQPISAAANIPVSQATAANLNATVVQATAANLNATVVGAVTANAGTNLNTSALSTSANQTTELASLATIAANTGAAVPAGANIIGFVSNDVCSQKTKLNLPISQSGTASVQLLPLSGSTVIYVCSLSLIAAGATTVALTTGTGAACGTGNTAVIGSTTIANSLSLTANGGLTLGSGAGTVALGAAAGELCMVLGNNVVVAGNLTYVQQ